MKKLQIEKSPPHGGEVKDSWHTTLPREQRIQIEVRRKNAVTDTNTTCEEKTTSPVQTSLSGRRIVKINEFLERLKSLGNHGPLGCSIKNMIFMREKRVGLKSCFIFKCNFCNVEESVWSEKDDEREMDVNTCAVSGTITTGGTHRRLERMLGAMNIPPMTDKTFKKYQLAISAGRKGIKVKKRAAEEEVCRTTENGRVGEDVSPHIAKGESSQHCTTSLRSDDSPDIKTPKLEIKEEIEVDEDQWMLQTQSVEEELMENVDWTDTSGQVKVEPKEEDEELEPFASVTVPSNPEDMFEEEY